MLPSRGFSRSASLLGTARTAFPNAPARVASQLPRSSVRQFGTTLLANNGDFNGTGATALGYRRIPGAISLPTTAASSSILFSIRQVRYASTQPQTPAAPSGAEGNIVDPASSPLTDFTSSVDLTGSDLLNMPEQIGYLKALGLDFGWFGPTPLTQWVLEHVYIMTGLPWWASLAAVAVLSRGVVFYGMTRATENSHKMTKLKNEPSYVAAQAKMKAAMFGGGTDANTIMMAARRDIQTMHQIAGVNMWWAAFPMLQAVLAFGMIRLFRAMAALPVPSLETGGILWFTDLSVADPYYMLPIASAVVMYSAMRLGMPYMDPAGRKMLGLLGKALLPIGVLATMWLPSGLQFYFLATSSLQWLQQFLIYTPAFRRLIGLPPVQTAQEIEAAVATRTTGGGSYQAPRTHTTTARVEKAGFVDSMKSAWNENVGDYMKTQAAKVEVKKSSRTAREFQEKRELEEREDYEARMARKRSKRLLRDE